MLILTEKKNGFGRSFPWQSFGLCGSFKAATPQLEDLCDLIKIRVALWLNHRLKDFHFSVHDFLNNLRHIRFCLGSKFVLDCC